MEFREMAETDLPAITALFIDYYNRHEEGEWTEETTARRIRQVSHREDSYCLVVEEKREILAFAMGYFEQFDDGQAYDLVEIVVAAPYQNRGIGTALMEELERRVKEKGAIVFQLEAINDEWHEHFYGKLGFHTVRTHILKSKSL